MYLFYMLVYGSSPAGLLFFTIVPIPKNKRGDRSNSANYRSTVLSSLCCKLFVNTVLENHQYN